MQYIVFFLGIVCAIGAIYYFTKSLKKKYKVIMAIGISIVVATVLEIFTFNYSKFQTLGSDYERKSYHWNTQSSTMSDGLKTSFIENKNSKIYIVEVSNVDTAIKCIDVTFSGDAKIIESTLNYTDDKYTKIGSTKEKTFNILPEEKFTSHLKLDLSGKAYILKFTFKVKKEHTITNIFLSCNHVENFDFNIQRALIVFICIFIALMFYLNFRKEEKLFDLRKGQWGEKRNSTKLLLVIILISEILFMLVLAWLSKTRFQIFNDLGASTDVYQELAIALSHGKYYGFCGILPVLLFYFPAYLITEHMLNTHFLALLFAILNAVIMAKFSYDIASKRKRKTNACIVVCAAVGFINISMLLFNVPDSNYYDLARLSELAFILFGLDMIYTAFFDKKVSWIRLLIGAFSMIIAVGCRSYAIFASILALITVANGLKEETVHRKEELGNITNSKNQIFNYFQLIFVKENIPYIICFMAPYLLLVIIVLYFNHIRTGSVLEFGMQYQLAANDMGYDYSLKKPESIPVTIFKGLFTLPRISGSFPYISPKITQVELLGHSYQIAKLGNFFYPLMWLIVLLPWSLRHGIKKLKDKTFVIACVILGVIACCFKPAFGIDDIGNPVAFAWFLYIPIIYIMYDLYDEAKTKKHRRKLILTLIITLTIISVLITTLLCFSDAVSNLETNNPTYFYIIKHLILFWK